MAQSAVIVKVTRCPVTVMQSGPTITCPLVGARSSLSTTLRMASCRRSGAMFRKKGEFNASA